MAQRWVYPVGNAIIGTALRLFARYRVEGLEAVPPYGPLLVVSNHLSNMDPPLLGVSLPRRLHFLAKRGLFKNPVVGMVMRGYGAFPIDREGRDIAGFNWMLQMLEREETVVIFPEGTRSASGLRRPLSGVAMLHLRSQAPILPVAITGTEHLGPPWRVFFPTGTIGVRIGQPFTLPSIEGKLSRIQMAQLTDMIMQRVAQLLPPRYRGVYAGAGAAPAAVVQMEEGEEDTVLL